MWFGPATHRTHTMQSVKCTQFIRIHLSDGLRRSNNNYEKLCVEISKRRTIKTICTFTIAQLIAVDECVGCTCVCVCVSFSLFTFLVKLYKSFAADDVDDDDAHTQIHCVIDVVVIVVVVVVVDDFVVVVGSVCMIRDLCLLQLQLLFRVHLNNFFFSVEFSSSEKSCCTHKDCFCVLRHTFSQFFENPSLS